MKSVYEIEVEKISKSPSNSGFITASITKTGAVVFSPTSDKNASIDKSIVQKLVKLVKEN